jgi:two-component system, chemotaxis family, sensor kinase CheA
VNEFLQQFALESRELAEGASTGLLALEQSPGDAERLDEVFRAFHTLKGSAAIVEFPAMESVMHAAEEILTQARAGTRSLTPERIGQCLAHLDQVIEWLDAIERAGELPRDAAGPAARVEERASERSAPVWLTDILAKYSGSGAAVRAATAIRFVPGVDSLYQGQDPLQRMTSLPGLLALDLAAREPWGPLPKLDPFRCNLVLTALSTARPEDVRTHMQSHGGDCAIVPIMEGGEAGPALPPRVRQLIEAQQALLDAGSARSFAGRVGAAGSAAANALRYCGRGELAEAISRATEQSLAASAARPLHDAFVRLLVGEGPVDTASAPAAAAPLEVVARTFRIDAERVDALVRLAGELTVVNNAIGHVVRLARSGDPALPDLLKERHEALERLVGELRRSVLGMRVRPLRTVLQRFPRLVREMSASLGKSVRLIVTGDDTEADKAIVDMLFEPLLHIVRNAIDHGVESTHQRAAAGKPPAATLRIKAERSGDQVLIEVSDDGAGVDLARVREVAVQRGLVTADQAAALTEADTLDLIFAPGFSTAGKVTEVSGRGVGMDAVRRAVERVAGQVSIASVAGRGTDVRLSLPFSVMMTPVMTVEAGGQMFGLPLEAIIETIRVPQAAISRVGVALVDDEGATLVVAAANGECGAFRVDRIVERLDLILKPLEGLLAGMRGIMGTTLLGDGRVLLVLDMAEILQ